MDTLVHVCQRKKKLGSEIGTCINSGGPTENLNYWGLTVGIK